MFDFINDKRFGDDKSSGDLSLSPSVYGEIQSLWNQRESRAASEDDTEYISFEVDDEEPAPPDDKAKSASGDESKPGTGDNTPPDLGSTSAKGTADSSGGAQVGDKVVFGGMDYEVVAKSAGLTYVELATANELAVFQTNPRYYSESEFKSRFEAIMKPIEGLGDVSGRYVEKDSSRSVVYSAIRGSDGRIRVYEESWMVGLKDSEADKLPKVEKSAAPVKSGAGASVDARPGRSLPVAGRPLETTSRGAPASLNPAIAEVAARREVSPAEIKSMEEMAWALGIAGETQKAADYREVIATLKGERGVQAKNAAHQAILLKCRQSMEMGDTRVTRGASGAVIGAGMLTAAALGYYAGLKTAPSPADPPVKIK